MSYTLCFRETLVDAVDFLFVHIVMCYIRYFIFHPIQESKYERVIVKLVEEKEAALQEKLVAENALSDLLRDTQEKDAAHRETCKILEVNRRTSRVTK